MKRYEGFYARYVKRFFDIICALAAIIVFSWLYLLIAVLVRINLGSPIIFHQERPGLIDPKTGKERIFRLCKFRSMTDARDENGDLLPDDQRLPRFGKLLRATSLDELPEAFNILRGDMSIIGPRPLLVKYLKDYGELEHSRHLVRPGLSGLSQVSGRNGLTWKRRFELDREYVENIGFLFDVKIIFMTVKKVFIHEGIEFSGKETITDYFASREASQSK